jgi:hypothetical protein
MACGLLAWFLISSAGAHDAVEMVQTRFSGDGPAVEHVIEAAIQQVHEDGVSGGDAHASLVKEAATERHDEDAQATRRSDWDTFKQSCAFYNICDGQNRCVESGRTYNRKLYHRKRASDRFTQLWEFRAVHIYDRNNYQWYEIVDKNSMHNKPDTNAKYLGVGIGHDNNVYHYSQGERGDHTLWRVEGNGAYKQLYDKAHGKVLKGGEVYDGNLYHNDFQGNTWEQWRLHCGPVYQPNLKFTGDFTPRWVLTNQLTGNAAKGQKAKVAVGFTDEKGNSLSETETNSFEATMGAQKGKEGVYSATLEVSVGFETSVEKTNSHSEGHSLSWEIEKECDAGYVYVWALTALLTDNQKQIHYRDEKFSHCVKNNEFPPECVPSPTAKYELETKDAKEKTFRICSLYADGTRSGSCRATKKWKEQENNFREGYPWDGFCPLAKNKNECHAQKWDGNCYWATNEPNYEHR